jgi:hypothetical protein
LRFSINRTPTPAAPFSRGALARDVVAGRGVVVSEQSESKDHDVGTPLPVRSASGRLQILALLALIFGLCMPVRSDKAHPCLTAVQRFCTIVQQGHGRLEECLHLHQSELSPASRAKLVNLPEEAPESPEAAGGQSLDNRGDPAKEPYQVSFRGGEIDSSGTILAGNNLMKLIPFHGRLYATTAVECDKALDPRHLGSGNSMYGPQILVLNQSKGRWHLEKEFGRKADGTPRFKRVTNLMAVRFETDGQGNKLGKPAEMLIATLPPFTSQERCAIFTGIEMDGKLQWVQTQFDKCIGQSGRAQVFYQDPVTKADRIYVGTQSGHGGEIYSGVYDAQAAGHIRWDPAPEESGHSHRIMAFAVLDNRLFAAAHTQLLERISKMTRNGPVVTWKRIYDYTGPTPLPLGANSGLRGLTPIPSPSDKTNSMLAMMEGSPGDVIRFDLTPEGVLARHETTIAPMFRSLPFGGNDFGAKKRAKYYIGAFNDIATIRDPATDEVFSLIGLEQYNRIPGHLRSAWFVSRTSRGRYSLHEVRQLPLRKGDQPLNPDLGLRAIRTFVVSPFEEDRGRVLFMGGFDPVFECGMDPRGDFGYTLHGNAWVYRVGIDTALKER